MQASGQASTLSGDAIKLAGATDPVRWIFVSASAPDRNARTSSSVFAGPPGRVRWSDSAAAPPTFHQPSRSARRQRAFVDASGGASPSTHQRWSSEPAAGRSGCSSEGPAAERASGRPGCVDNKDPTAQDRRSLGSAGSSSRITPVQNREVLFGKDRPSSKPWSEPDVPHEHRPAPSHHHEGGAAPNSHLMAIQTSQVFSSICQAVCATLSSSPEGPSTGTSIDTGDLHGWDLR